MIDVALLWSAAALIGLSVGWKLGQWLYRKPLTQTPSTDFGLDRDVYEEVIDGRLVQLDTALGHLWVEHGGDITWDELQKIKSHIWGAEARAIEIFPASSHVVNSTSIRHLWRLGEGDFCPDLLGQDGGSDLLSARCAVAWAEARSAVR